MNPTPEQVAKIMQQTGMDFLQAHNHLKCRFLLQARMRRGSDRPQSRDLQINEPQITAEAVAMADLCIAKAMGLY